MPLHTDDFKMLGWNMYMEPEKAARGLALFEFIRDRDLDDIPPDYPDLSRFPVYTA